MYRVSDGVRSTQNQDGTIILDIQRGRVLRLNVTASLIFQWLQQGQTESDIIEKISQQFCISREVAQIDVAELLKSMLEARLVHNESAELRR